MFIVLEGTDSTGKTTLCEALAKKTDAVLYTAPTKRYLQQHTHIRANTPAEECYQHYRAGIYDASHEIKIQLQSGKRIVCDRYWLTTYTYYRVLGVPVSRSDFKSIISPTLTVILALNYDIQMQRMLARGLSEWDCRMLNAQRELAVEFYKSALECNTPFIFIDTYHFSPAACVEIILCAINVGRQQ